MLEWIKRFFTDAEYFLTVVSGARTRVRALIAAIGLGLQSGVIPLADLSERLGDVGWYVGYAMIILAFLIKGGDQTKETLERLAKERPEWLGDLVKPGPPP